METPTFCKHGRLTRSFCAECRITYLEELVKNMNKDMKEMEAINKLLEHRFNKLLMDRKDEREVRFKMDKTGNLTRIE